MEMFIYLLVFSLSFFFLFFWSVLCTFKAACGLAAPAESCVGARFQSFTGGIETTGDCSGTSPGRETEAQPTSEEEEEDRRREKDHVSLRGVSDKNKEREREREKYGRASPGLTDGN